MLFEELVGEINTEFKTKDKKVAWKINNCSAHRETEDLSHVKLIFISLNIASVSQPMDQGIIRSLKVHYRKHLVRVILAHLDQGKRIFKVSLLKAIQLLVSACNGVSKETVINCFRIANIFPKRSNERKELC